MSSALFAQPNKQYYWKGGSGNFNDPTMWWVDSYNSGTTAIQAPNSTNSTFFMAAGFTSAGNTITVASNANCDTMFWDNTIALGNAPRLVSNSAVSLDIYGSFALAENMNFDYRGQLRLRSQRAGIETIQTKGKTLQVLEMVIDGSINTEFKLLSNLHVDDLNNIVTNSLATQGGVFKLLSGTLNTNSKAVSLDYFITNNNSPNRGLIMTNSSIDIDGYGASWQVDFDNATSNYRTFDVTGSHLTISAYTYTTTTFGRGMSYDSITLKTHDSRPSSYSGASNQLNIQGSHDAEVQHFFLELSMYFSDNNNRYFNIHNLYFQDKRATFGWRGYANINVRLENVFTPPNCSHFYPIAPNITTGQKMNIIKMTPGTLILNNVLLENVNCDVTGGKSYIANNSIDAGRNSANWTINEPTSRQLYFSDVVNEDWHTLGNWREKIGVNFFAATCLPTPVDDVFFDASSYSSHTEVRFDSAANCRDISFDASIPANVEFNVASTFHIFGSFRGAPSLTVNGNAINYSGKNDTIQTNGAFMNTNTLLTIDSEYRMVGNYTSNTNRQIRGYSPSILRMGSDTLTAGSFLPATIFFDSTQVYLHKSGAWVIYDYGGAKNYSGNATFNFMSAATELRITKLPNVVFHDDMRVFIQNIEIQGDLTLKGNGNFSRSYHGDLAYNIALNVSGTLPPYNGDIYLTAGKRYIFSSNNGSFINVAGDFNAIGNCAEVINIETTNTGATGTTPLDVAGNVNIDFAYIQGINNINATTITATNSIDGGNNSNITFPANAGTTFYWRALSSDPSDFDGSWSDQGHWTTNPANLVGDNTCIPSILDSVIFDNKSFSLSSNSCLVTGTVFCKTLLFRADARLTTNSTNTIVNIDESLFLANNMTRFDYRGIIKMIGNGIVNANGTPLEISRLEFDNPTGVFDLQSALFLDNSWAGGSAGNRLNGVLALLAGTLNTNNYDLTISSQFSSNTIHNRTLNLGTSTITILCNGTYGIYFHNAFGNTPWDIRTSTNMTLNASNSTIVFKNNTHTRNDHKAYHMGDGFTYNAVRVEENNSVNTIHGNIQYGYLELLGTSNLVDDNSMDSLRMEGGEYYYLGAGKVQTLHAPDGKLIVNGTAGNSVFLESDLSGTTAFLHKPYGYALCMDFIKVKDIEGTKETNLATVPTAPTDFQAIHPFLEFQTGVNSDNINGTATGIWAFNLPPLVLPAFTNPDSVEYCQYASPRFAPITMTGTSPYYIDYTWTNNLGASGSHVFTVVDNDNDPATPFTHLLQIPGAGRETTLSMNLQTSRCGELTPSTPAIFYVVAPAKDTLIDFSSTATCDLNNEPNWQTFMDDVAGEPVVAFLDKVNASDNQALGNMVVDVFFDPTVQTVNYMGTNYPYLQRHWDMNPTNNSAAGIRLFFTQAELNALAAQTFWGTNPSNPMTGTINPATDIEVWKYASGIIGVGPPIILPHTVLTMAGAITEPFDDVTDVIALEVEVASFSHFIIVPTQPVLLTLDLNNFEAKAINDNQVQIDWAAANEADAAYYEIQRSQDAIEAQTIETVQALGLAPAEYQLLDNDPHRGVSYYRVKAVALDGSATYSDWKAIELKGWNVVRVYPVPTSEVLNIELNANVDDQVSLVVYDALGILVYQSTQTIQPSNRQRLQVATSQLATGIYYLRISNDAGYTQQRKFVVE